MRRGRPRHPDILTPREWEVLELLRRDLSNREIAEKLDISFDGVRYHVSEILSKLGVSSRREAAAWQPPQRSRLPAVALLTSPFSQSPVATTVKAGGVIVLASAAVVLLLLVFGLLSMSERDPAIDLDDPRLVYSTEVGTTNEQGRGWPTRQIRAFNASTQAMEVLVEYGGVGDFPAAEAVSRQAVFYATENRLVRVELDGGGQQELFRQPEGTGYIQDIALSPDETMIALVSDVIRFLEADSGAEIARVASIPDGFAGTPWKVHWRSDNSGVVVSGGTSSSRPGGRATVLLNGSVTVHGLEEYALLTRDGRFLAETPGLLCDDVYSPSQHELRLHNLDSGRATVIVSDPAKAFTAWAWSPSGHELLYQERDYLPDSGCDSEAPRWFAFSPAAGTSHLVGDLEALFRGWYGPRLVELVCSQNRLQLPHAVLTDRWADEQGRCVDGPEDRGELRLSARTIDYLRDIWLLGFIGSWP